jgi:hypothetical protein
MSAELNFAEDRAARIDYLMTQLSMWRNSADEAAGNYCLWIYDTDYDLYCEADDALRELEAYYLD